MKERKNYIAVIASAIVIALCCGLISFGADAAPGSAQDPVVTKSYVDSVVSALQTKVDALEKAQAEVPTGSAVEAPRAATFTVVEVAAGSRLIGGEGTQFILRSGSAAAIDNGANGVSDLTSGADLKGGAAVEKNHLLLVPRADGRGISCTTKCYVMVLGDYTLQ